MNTELNSDLQKLCDEGQWAELWKSSLAESAATNVIVMRVLIDTGWLPLDVDERALFAKLADSVKKLDHEIVFIGKSANFLITGGFSGGGHYAVSDDGKLLGIANIEKGVDLWNLADRKIFATIRNVNACVLALNRNANVLAAAGGVGDNDCAIWSLIDGQKIADLQPTPKCWKSIALHPNGETLAMGCQRGTVRLWHWRTKKFFRYPATGKRCDVLSFSPDGSLLAAGSSETLRLWKFPEGDIVTDIRIPFSIDHLLENGGKTHACDIDIE